MYVLSTLYALRQHIGLEASDTSEDMRLLDALSSASASIERHTQRRFLPRQESILHTMNPQNRSELLLADDLLTLQSITNGDGTTIAIDDVIHVSSGVIILTNGATFSYVNTVEKSINVRGIWGYHPNWTTAWADSNDTVQDASLSSSVSTITVTDADAGTSPRFQVGQLIRIEDEYLVITAVDTSTNILTVERGAQGTTATTHANGATIEIYQVPNDIRQLTLRWALWLYREPDSFARYIPPILAESIAGFRRIGVGN